MAAGFKRFCRIDRLAAPGSATYNGVLVDGGNIVGVSGSAWGAAPTGLNVLGVNAERSFLRSARRRRHGRQSGSYRCGHECDQRAGRAGRYGRRADANQQREHRRKSTSIIQAGALIPINILNAGTTQLVPAVSGKTIYVTAWDVIAAGTTNFTFEYGTGTNWLAGPGADRPLWVRRSVCSHPAEASVLSSSSPRGTLSAR